jgi:hypothetical protein
MDRPDSGETPKTQSPQFDAADPADAAAAGDQPFVAKLIRRGDGADVLETGDEVSAEPTRVGSPFGKDVLDAPGGCDPVYGEFGPFVYTAMGASAAAVLVLLFAAAGAWWFPAGGALVAMLGAALSIIGLFSTKKFRYAALATLPLHMGLFFLSYARSLA